MQVSSIEPIASLSLQERRELDELLGRLPESRALEDMSLYVISEQPVLRRVVAPTDPAVTVGTIVESFGHFYYSTLHLSSSPQPAVPLSVADRLVVRPPG